MVCNFLVLTVAVTLPMGWLEPSSWKSRPTGWKSSRRGSERAEEVVFVGVGGGDGDGGSRGSLRAGVFWED